MSDEDAMRMELQRLQQQADETTDESLESTRRMVALAEETQDIGIKTITTLDEQGQQLDRIENNLDTINADMKEAEKHLSQLERFCGLFVCCWSKQNNFEKSEKYKKGFNSEEKGPSKATSNQNAASSGGVATSGYINKVTNDDREEEMDENLGQVAGIVDNLKSMALDMGDEIDRQNVQIGRLGEKTESNEQRIGQANKRIDDKLR